MLVGEQKTDAFILSGNDPFTLEKSELKVEIYQTILKTTDNRHSHLCGV